jgi:hypothetical protein
MATAPVATKDMGVASMVEPWRGDGGSASVTEFFNYIEMVAELGGLSTGDKVHLARA